MVQEFNEPMEKLIYMHYLKKKAFSMVFQNYTKRKFNKVNKNILM